MRIYVSSSFVDLKDYRAAVSAAIRGLGHDYLAMEDYGAEDQLPVEKCLQDVAQCDLYVGFFAWRYGFVPEGYDRSITELEYRKAVEQNIPALIFLLDEDTPWPPRFMDKAEAGQRIAALRDEFKANKLVSFFTSPDDLKAKATTAIARQAEKVRLAQEAAKQEAAKQASLTSPTAPAEALAETLAEAPARPQDERPPTNLPVPHTPLVGHLEAIEEWTELLRRPTTRLLTLIGFGGLGKTRIALHLAHLCRDDFAHGVWWIDLEEARDGEAMVQRIASALRLPLQPQPSVREQLWNFHRDREMLLVLDNVEQIPDAAEVTHELLQAGPRVTYLVTSRRALELHAEQRVEVSPLPQADAETLFVERARARQPDFAVTEENAADVAELCRHLEGVPLAIELAASRSAAMSPREILNRLDEQFRLLQSRAPDLRPRQRALRAAIDWSYELLSDEDKALFAQLAVFAGGFTVEAVEAVCDGFDAFEGVLELRRQSLLRAETTATTQQTRFFMLASVYAYAQEKLAATGQEEQRRRRHAEHFLHFAEERVARLRTRDEMVVLAELSPELDNLQVALQWARTNQQHEWCARLSLALHQPLYRRGFWAKAHHCLQTGEAAIVTSQGVAAGDAPRLQAAQRLQAALLLHLAGLELDMGEAAGAQAKAEASLTQYRALDDGAGTADALNLLGLLATEAGRLDEAQKLFQEALALRLASDHHGRAIALHNLARLASRRGDKAEAQRLYEEALAQRRASDYERGEAETLGDLGVVAQETGDHETARRLYHASLAIRRKLDDRLGIALMLYNLAEIAELDGDVQRAVTLFRHAQKIFCDLQSAYAAAPGQALQRLEERLGAEPFALLRRAAESTAWEAIV